MTEDQFALELGLDPGGTAMKSGEVHLILANFYLSKQIESAAKASIESSIRISESSNNHSKILSWLTGAIVVLTLLMVYQLYG